MQLVLSLVPGGTERLTVELATRLAGRFRMMVCCLDEPGPWADEVREAGIPVATLGRQPGFHPGLGSRVAALARDHGVRVVHCHHFSPFVYGWLAGFFNRDVRVLYTEHGRLSDTRAPLRRWVANAVLSRLSGQAYAVSHDLRRHLIGAGFAASRLAVIHNGIDPGEPPRPEARAAARVRFGLPVGAFVIGTVARLDPVKDLGATIAALAAVRAAIPTAMLTIAGDGPERASLEAAAARAGVAEAVRWIGYTPAARDLLLGCDLYVNSSISEGISLTILEAMAAELPVVATDVGGTPEVVVPGETGLLVPARSPEWLARAIIEISTSSDRGRTMGAAGRRRVESSFALDRMVNDYATVYDRLSAQSAR